VREPTATIFTPGTPFRSFAIQSAINPVAKNPQLTFSNLLISLPYAQIAYVPIEFSKSVKMTL
jgi:hypothetical protein